MSRGQYLNSDKKEKYAQSTQSKDILQAQPSKHSIDKWPGAYRKVTTSSGLSQQKLRSKNQRKESELLDIYGSSGTKGAAGRQNAANMKLAAEGGGQSRAKSHKPTGDPHQMPIDPKQKRLEEFRQLVGEFELDDSYGNARYSENSNNKRAMQQQLQTMAMTPQNNRQDTKQSRSRQLYDNTAIEEPEQSRNNTEQQTIINSPNADDHNPLVAQGADKAQEALQDASQNHNNAMLHQRNLQNIYHTVEEQFLIKQRKSLTRDWIAKNKNEKPQSFRSFCKHQKNWTIDQVIILEMWDEESQVPRLDGGNKNKNSSVNNRQINLATEQELSFQKMLVNNMDAVFKIFFTGMTVLRVKRKKQQDNQPMQDNDSPARKQSTFEHIEQNLSELERKGIIQTRVRGDTGVKQFHAGQIFEYLKDNMQLRQNQCLLVLTNADLYPKDGWTFVFGMTKQSWRICIQSYARHHPNFAQHTDAPTRMFDAKVAKLVQYRAIKTACHELCHVLSMRHCQMYECLMNGSSQLDEADQKPFALCPVCLRKMSYYLDFEGQELPRYKKLREVVKIMNHKDPNQCYKRELVLFANVIAALTELARQTPVPVPRSSLSNQQADNEGGTKELMKRMDRKMLAIQQAHYDAQQLSDGFSSEQLTHQPLSSARARPGGYDGSSEISLQELQIYRNNNRHGLHGHSLNGNQDEKTTIVQKLCQYMCCCFSCLQRPDESKNEYQHEHLVQIVQQPDQDPQYADRLQNKRSAKLQFKEKRANGQQAQVTVQRVPQHQQNLNNDDQKMIVGDQEGALGRPNQNEAKGGEVVEGAENVREQSKADGRNNQKIDLEAGDHANKIRVNQKKIPRIYDVDESMSLQRMARKAKASKQTVSEEMSLADNDQIQLHNNNQQRDQILQE